MNRCTSPELLTAEQIRKEIADSVAHWKHLREHGCEDPFWPDGVNLNLVRMHVIYWEQLLAEKSAEEQLSLFDAAPAQQKSLAPPRVPDTYMVPTGQHAHRLDDSWNACHDDKLVYSY